MKGDDLAKALGIRDRERGQERREAQDAAWAQPSQGELGKAWLEWRVGLGDSTGQIRRGSSSWALS